MRSHLSKMTDELHDGQCSLVLLGPKELIRVVAVAAVRLQRPIGDERILVQVGTWSEEEGRAAFCCQLPGLKQRAGEQASDAANRALRRDLMPLATDIEIIHEHTEYEVADSQRTGVPTNYIKTIFDARFTNSTAFADANFPVVNSADSDDSIDVYLVQSDHAALKDQFKLWTWLTPGEFAAFRESEIALQQRLGKIAISAEMLANATEQPLNCCLPRERNSASAASM